MPLSLPIIGTCLQMSCTHVVVQLLRTHLSTHHWHLSANVIHTCCSTAVTNTGCAGLSNSTSANNTLRKGISPNLKNISATRDSQLSWILAQGNTKIKIELKKVFFSTQFLSPRIFRLGYILWGDVLIMNHINFSI